jgi:hypothetical protein
MGCSKCPAGSPNAVGLDLETPCRDAGGGTGAKALGAEGLEHLHVPGSPIQPLWPHAAHRPLTSGCPPPSSGGGGAAVKASAIIFISVPCAIAPIGATGDAYKAFLIAQPGVDPATIKVAVGCRDGAGRRRRRLLAATDSALDISMEYAGPTAAGVRAVTNTQDCCPVVEGCDANSLCAAPGVADAGVTGGAAGPSTTTDAGARGRNTSKQRC